MDKGKARILIVEDEAGMREVLSMLLEGEGYQVTAARDGKQGLGCLDSEIFDLVITDIKMPGATGFEILRKAQELSPDTLVIVITAFGTVESGIEAMKLGAFDYINKPFKIDEIRLIVRGAIERRSLSTEVKLLRESVRSCHEITNIIGKSEPMQRLLRMIPKVAASSSNALITGESGTGKELVAAALHSLSPRASKNFVAINCASLPEGLLESELFGHMRGSFTGAHQNKQGLFEVADGGTLFLDEIGEMPMTLQAKILRVIESGTFRRVGGTTDLRCDVRIIAATNRILKDAVRAGGFREDLFYRLNVVPLHVPALRERAEDIPLLVEHFCAKYSQGRQRQFSGSALRRMMEHPWSGNVRELENLIERVMLLSDKDVLTETDIPEEIGAQAAPPAAAGPDISKGISLEEEVAAIEKNYLAEALRLTGGNKTEAAKLLGLTFRSFRHKLSKYGMKDAGREQPPKS